MIHVVNLIGSLLTNIPDYEDKHIFVIFMYVLHTIMLVWWLSYIRLSRPLAASILRAIESKLYCYFEVKF